ncbi:MAG: peptidylprolyl isomerase [Nannocystaceae bacterium]
MAPTEKNDFGGGGGRRELLDAVIHAELLRQRAVASGLDGDRRVRWALVEELASLHRLAELEHREPFSDAAGDEAAISSYYEAHRQTFLEPQRRGVHGVLLGHAGEAEAALASLRSGAAELSDFGTPVTIRPTPRDDAEFPAFHRVLFGASLRDGDWLPQPVLVRRKLLVGRLEGVVEPKLRSLNDPAVRDEVIRRIRAPRLARAEAALLREMRASEVRVTDEVR